MSAPVDLAAIPVARIVEASEGDQALVELTMAYSLVEAALEKLPASRNRALAKTNLEDSFSRAVFAALGVDSALPPRT